MSRCCAASRRSPRRRGRHHLSGKREVAWYDDELSVSGPPHGEELVVCFLEHAQDVGRLRTAFGLWRAPANHDALTDIGRREVDHEPVLHA
jgi:hypothetical protein